VDAASKIGSNEYPYFHARRTWRVQLQRNSSYPAHDRVYPSNTCQPVLSSLSAPVRDEGARHFIASSPGRMQNLPRRLLASLAFAHLDLTILSSDHLSLFLAFDTRYDPTLLHPIPPSCIRPPRISTFLESRLFLNLDVPHLAHRDPNDSANMRWSALSPLVLLTLIPALVLAQGEAGQSCTAADGSQTGGTPTCIARKSRLAPFTPARTHVGTNVLTMTYCMGVEFCRQGSCSAFPTSGVGKACTDPNSCVGAETANEYPPQCGGASGAQPTCGGESTFCYSVDGTGNGAVSRLPMHLSHPTWSGRSLH
jgi:hypothetical protein